MLNVDFYVTYNILDLNIRNKFVLIEELVEPIDAFRKRLAITPAVLFLISAVTAV